METLEAAQVHSDPNGDLTFRAKAVTVEPLDQLGDVSFDSNSVEGKILYPEQNATYVLRTYLTSEKPDGTEIGAEYLVDERTFTDLTSNKEFSVHVPHEGTDAPSGNYYVTTFLMRQVNYADAEGTSQTAYVAIGSAGSETTVSYTNSNAPSAPQTVTLTAAGNETMVAGWDAVEDADGYRITIYDADGNDTGLGYEYSAAQFGTMPGLSYNGDTGTYTIDMAMTVGDPDAKDAEGNSLKLEPNQNYRVGVTAYKTNTSIAIGEDEDGTPITRDVKYYGSETKSPEANLPKYEPLEMTLQLSSSKGSSKTLSADEDTHIYNGCINGDSSWALGVWDADENNSTAFTVTRMDTNVKLGDDDEDSYYEIPDFEGSLMLSVTGTVVNNNGTTDTTTRYVLLTKDEAAPIVTLDADTFRADSATRSYTITGVTEPGATVWLGDPDQTYPEDSSPTANEKGEFTLTGTVPENATELFQRVAAMDAAGNKGSGDALVTTRPAESQPPDEPDEPSNPTTPSGGSDSDPSYSPIMDVSDGGDVSVSPRTPSEGDEVTITVEPDRGYEVGDVTVTDRDGDTVRITANRDGTYTFEQPRGRVTIEVTFVPTGTATFFTDVPESFWAYNEIKWAYDNGYVNGTSATTFSPNSSISRQQVWMILARLSGADPANMAEARTWAMENGISDGTTPGNAVTRQQLVALLYRYATMMGYANDARADLSIYPDADTVASYAVEPMQWSVANSIVTGTSDGTLNPTGTATRAQFAVILYRFWSQIG